MYDKLTLTRVRRITDWTLMKCRNYDINSDNFYNKKLFCFYEWIKLSVNALRHSFLTDKYLNNPMTNLKDMTETAKEVGHSVLRALE